MKALALVSALATAAALITALPGCSAQTVEEASGGAPESSRAEAIAAEPSSSAEAEGPSSSQAEAPAAEPSSSAEAEGPSSSQAEAPAAEPSSSSEESPVPPDGQKTLTGTLIPYDNAVFGADAEAVLGVQADLDAWNKAVSERDELAEIFVSTFNTQRSLTQDEITTILDTLEGLPASVMEELENPATGGATHVAAFDQDGNRLWSATLSVDWLVVSVPGDSLWKILKIDQKDAFPIQNIAD